MDLQIIGVIGAGVMGGGIAQNLAQTGHQVILVDLSSEILDQAKAGIRENIRLQTLLQKNGGPDNPDKILGRISFGTDYDLFRQVVFIIENVPEKWEVKKEVYPKIDRICPEQCIFASNTSAIPIARLASLTERASQVIGMHFMNPAPLTSTVEVIPGPHTSEETVEKAKKLLHQMGKEGIEVNDSPGFVTTRVLMVTINEAIFLLQEQVTTAKDVDRIFKTCFGHRMGPLETADLIGLDTILYSLNVLYDSFNNSKYRPCPLLKKMVAAGIYGQKSGQGFYNYSV